MITLDKRHILLNASAADKQGAIRQVGQLLVDSGNIEAGYITSMFNREKVANTYLGNGIAIPHGLPEDRELIHQTGIAVVQLPAGITWNPGETVRLVVGIAAKSDEHIDVLRRLTRVLGDQEQVARLECTSDPGDIIAALTGERPAPPASQEREADYAAYFDAVILNKTGFHARPAASFVTLAKSFQSDIKVRYRDQVANGKSLVSLLKLGAVHGVTVRVSAQGSDAQAALEALRTAIASGLGDEIVERRSR
jgi:phosphotransferase system HPr (HPr) family protein